MITDIVILAAGQGTRMRSSLPKVLHTIAGQPMVEHVIRQAQAISDSRIHLVTGHGSDQVRDALADYDINYIMQTEQLGTGHAVAQALPALTEGSRVLILYGDVPLTPADVMQSMLNNVTENSMSLLTVELENPHGYGRIVRTAGAITAIVEHKDASESQRSIREINTGIMAVSQSHLARWLPELSCDNAQGEYYLTDIIAMAAKEKVAVVGSQPEFEQQVQGVNNRLQQAELERWYQLQQALVLMESGVSLADPARIDVRGTLTAGQDCFIDINTLFEGQVVLGNGVIVGANCVLKNCTVEEGTVIEPNSMIDQSKVAENCRIGPFARLRPQTELAAGAKIGNFVETKKSQIGAGAKVNHLTYIGDAEIGERANIGAGTITCNYDGVNKFKTKVGADAFIGSNSALVAPVSIGEKAVIGAGSTITKDVSDYALSVARGRQISKDNWKK
ncbi:bifunctional UDP-N-acetylglucosamine diphosphorylase/glucosamine-1-phosphate N-acetyltransferase GlmU [Oceanospirillum sediminis]|uniref:Bifunctional protein GlmU n=1 Tax=Oceanospirillum sediminis TaxID=2760088 RepID=A0A839IUJ3_9GAMM|nr:bifunctional UDP-N-acetylglucosamine diphosphorylase/glucosamine-1-phosphate N-acetyltransferase GlmU [Oceanospirillum sediminis]MBB1488352.1 bifunctional UDP-N-acetylglucosamine diphosphorylase/glucosamine-1-phosphate N-acetyltransferase GlmU [Oceanospirillum sediminis]